MRTTYKVPNISCATCAMTIESHFETFNIDAKVNVGQQKVIFKTEDDVPQEFLIKELKEIGFRPVITDEAEMKARKYEKFRLILATILVLPLAYTMFHHFGIEIVPDLMLNGYFQLPFAALLQFYVGYRFYKNSYYQIKTKNLGMDVLIVLGTSVAFFYSLYLTVFAPTPHLFFETSGMLIWMVAIGEYLEHMSKARTTDTLRELMSLSVNEVRLLKGGVESIVSLEEVTVGDEIRVLAGERIALDGEIIEGTSYIDNSVITGEPVPKHYGFGDKVIGSTTNLTNTLIIKVQAVGTDTVLAKIIETVEETALIKPKFQRTVDTIAKYFVFAVVLLAIITFAIYQFILQKELATSLTVMIAILIVSCPCALGLATPTSIAVASGIAFKNKILYKGGEFFELSDKIDAIAFDKTGTLTKGELAVLTYAGDIKYLAYTKSLENHSNHPIGEAINRYQPEVGVLEIQNYQVIDGKGIKADINKDRVLVGSYSLFTGENIENPYQKEYEQYTKEGKIVVFTAVNEKLVNMVVLEDEIKEGIPELIEALQKKGITPYLITGDNENTANHLAKQLNITGVYAGVLPNEKALIIRELQEKHPVVAFVGDGINDAPALKQADVSFSVSNASDIASDTADVVLLEPNLEIVLMSMDLSKKTTINIKQNLWWAFMYNVVMIPLAVFNIASPLLAGSLHVVSSILVVLNALRLRFYKYKRR